MEVTSSCWKHRGLPGASARSMGVVFSEGKVCGRRGEQENDKKQYQGADKRTLYKYLDLHAIFYPTVDGINVVVQQAIHSVRLATCSIEEGRQSNECGEYILLDAHAKLGDCRCN